MNHEQIDAKSTSSTELIIEVIDSVKTILVKEFQLARLEISDEVKKSIGGIQHFIVAICLFLISGLLSVFFLVHFLHWWLFFNYSLWVPYGVVTIGTCILALVLFLVGRAKLKKISLVPSSAVEALQ
jgi:uncharacterized membrane protein